MSAAMRFEELQIGAEIPPLSKTPTTRQLVQWAGASGDFHPIHYDLEFARGEGLPGLIVHGLLKYQSLVQMLSDWVGPAGGVRKVTTSYKDMDSPGDTLTCAGAVVGIRIEVGLRIVDCEIWVENQRGERTTTGSAAVWFPAGVGEDR
jgi:acyl dehydratase